MRCGSRDGHAAAAAISGCVFATGRVVVAVRPKTGGSEGFSSGGHAIPTSVAGWVLLSRGDGEKWLIKFFCFPSPNSRSLADS